MSLRPDDLSQLDNLGDHPALKQLQLALWGEGEGRGAAVMVGAGFSRAAIRDSYDTPEAPLWGDFARLMAADLGPGSSTDPLKLAEEYEAALGRPALERLIRLCVPDASWRPGEVHDRLLGLPWADVLTTNWDTLLERAAPSDPMRTYEVVHTIGDISRTRAPRIVKLHGTLPSQPPFIFTAEDFRTYPARFAPFVNLAQQALLENELCLVGFSGDDPNFLAWAGWVRDQLGASARRIRLVGVLRLSEARRKVWERQGVTPIDLAPLVDHLDPAEQHLTANRLFVDALWSAKPKPRHAWSPSRRDSPHRTKTTSVEALSELTAQWREDRETYPQWLVAPPEVRERLRHDVFVDYSHRQTAFDAAPVELRAAYLAERLWRLEVALLPLDLWTKSAVDAVLTQSDGVPRAMRMQMLLARLRQARFDQVWHEFDEICERIKILNAGTPDLAYERALRARDQRDLSALKTLVGAVAGDDPVWSLRRAALLAELDDHEAAAEAIGLALRELRRRRAIDRQSLALLSREAWATFLLEAARYGFPQTPGVLEEDLTTHRYAGARTDPRVHYRAIDEQLQTFAKRRLEHERPIEVRFDAGYYRDNRRTIRMVTSNASTELAAFLRMADHVGLPAELDNVSIAGHQIRSLLNEVREPTPIELRLAARFVLDCDRGLIDRQFSRTAIARMPLETVKELIVGLRQEADLALEAREPARGWSDRAKPKIELVSRLAVRLDPEACTDLFRWGLGLMRLPQIGDRYLNEPLRNLLKRSLEGVPPAARPSLYLEAMEAPLAGELDRPTSRHDWPDLAEIFAAVPVARLAGDAAWTRRIAQLIELAADEHGDRPAALQWLIQLHEAKVLTEAEVSTLSEAVWAGVRAGALPAATGMRGHAFLILPEPPESPALQAFQAQVVEPLCNGQVTEARLAALHGAVVRRRGLFALDARTAVSILEALLAYRPRPVPKDEFFDETRPMNAAIEWMMAATLPDAVLTSLEPHDLDAGLRTRLVELVCDPTRQALVTAASEVIRLAPEHRPAVIAALRRGLTRHDRNVAAAIDGVGRFVSPYRSAGIILPVELAADVAALCMFRSDAHQYQALRGALMLIEADAMPPAETERVIEVLGRLRGETDYAEWAETDPRTRVLTLMRAICVSTALLLQQKGHEHDALRSWIEVAPCDPAPEVRFAVAKPQEGLA